MRKGIDVSYSNGEINWAQVKPQIDFAILRAGYGRNNIDARFVENARACTEQGIPMGLYWFSYAYTVEMAEKEAEYCLEQAKQYKIDYPITFDFEYDSVRYANENGVAVTKELAMALTKAFCDKIKAAGYHVAIQLYRTDGRNQRKCRFKLCFGEFCRSDVWMAEAGWQMVV